MIKNALEAIQHLRASSPDAREELFPLLYIPVPELREKIEWMDRYLATSNPSQKLRQAAGRTMEQIAYLIFKGIQVQGLRIDSVQSVAHQYDLLVGDGSVEWKFVAESLLMPPGASEIFVEAKAINRVLGVRELARVVGIMELHLTHAGLAIVFTLKGASGITVKRRPRALRGCRVIQVVFNARTKRHLVILSWSDIKRIAESAAFLRAVSREVRAIQELTVSPGGVSAPVSIELPSHLRPFA